MEAVKEFKFKMDKVEKVLSTIVTLLFLATFIDANNKFLMVLFYGAGAVILVYYFGWYRKKPPYIKVEGDRVTIHHVITYKPLVLNTSEIKDVKVNEKNIELELSSPAAAKVKIFSNLLDAADREEFVKMVSKE